MIKIKIIKYTDKMNWYSHLVGECLFVEDDFKKIGDELYYIKQNSINEQYIPIENTINISVLRLKKLKNILDV